MDEFLMEIANLTMPDGLSMFQNNSKKKPMNGGGKRESLEFNDSKIKVIPEDLSNIVDR